MAPTDIKNEETYAAPLQVIEEKVALRPRQPGGFRHNQNWEVGALEESLDHVGRVIGECLEDHRGELVTQFPSDATCDGCSAGARAVLDRKRLGRRSCQELS